MQPRVLGLASHDKPVPSPQFERDRFLGLPMSELKSPCAAQRQAGYGWAITETRLTVAVPADAVATIPIEVGQNGIE